MRKALLIPCLCLLMFSTAVFIGCGKETAPTSNLETTSPEAIPQSETPESTVVNLQEAAPAPTFDYKPTSLGVYIQADPNIEAEPEALDRITATMSDKKAELIRRRVSDRQFDLIKNGHQQAGFLLVDIPQDMLERAAQSEKGFLELADHLGNQVMPELYPSHLFISGGGPNVYESLNEDNYGVYMTVLYSEKKYLPKCVNSYVHEIYIGENYVYDFWHDTAGMADGGQTIIETLSAEDIQFDRNGVDFAWSYADIPMGEALRDKYIKELTGSK